MKRNLLERCLLLSKSCFLSFVFALSCVLAGSLPAQATLTSDFQAINANASGPFGPVELQGATGRAPGMGDVLGHFFKAGFRSPLAEKLARQENFYLGNLFVTNYYELMGEVLYGGFKSNHPIEHTALVLKAAQANSRASIMVRNWILEKYYVSQFPLSKIAQSFNLRAISDYETERGFAHYFFDVYLRGLKDEYQYLTAFLLLKESPINDAPVLNEARNIVTRDYDILFAQAKYLKPVGERYYEIRNAVHNQLSRDVIPLIDRYKADFQAQEPKIVQNLMKVRANILEYYSSSTEKVGEIAIKTGNNEIYATAMTLRTQSSLKDLAALSRLVAHLKVKFTDNSLYNADISQNLILVSLATQYMAKEILNLKAADGDLPLAIETLINCAYAEGFLITDNRNYFLSELATATSTSALKTLLLDLTSISASTLTEAVSPTFNQWLQAEPKMQSFIDGTLKSSSLNAASVFAERLHTSAAQ